MEKRGGWKTSRMTHLPKRGFGPPLVWYVFHPPQVSVLCFSCTKIHVQKSTTEQTRSSFRGVQKFSGERVLWCVLLPPHVLQPPQITAQSIVSMKIHREIKGRFRKRVVVANVPSCRLSFRGNMRTYPRSGFRSGGTSECTLVPVFVPGEHPPEPPFWKTTLLGSSEKCPCLGD